MTHSSVLITNANVFDGRSEHLSTGMSVLVEGNTIAKIAPSITAPASATVLDAAGRTLTPGFVGAHEHLMMQMSFAEAFACDDRYYAYVATQTARTNGTYLSPLPFAAAITATPRPIP